MVFIVFFSLFMNQMGGACFFLAIIHFMLELHTRAFWIGGINTAPGVKKNSETGGKYILVF